MSRGLRFWHRFLGPVIATSVLTALTAVDAKADSVATPAVPTESRAERLFREGRAAMRAGDLPTACDRFAESQVIEPSSGGLLNLAVCEERLGRLASAHAHYQAFLAHLSGNDERRELAEKAVRSLATRIPVLRLRLADGWPPDTQISIDGRRVEPTPPDGSVSVNPGQHLVFVTAASARKSRELSVDVHEGPAPTLLDIEPPAPMKPAAIQPNSPATVLIDPSSNVNASPIDASRRPRPLAYVSAAVGASGLAVALIAGGLVIHDKSVVAEHCPNRACDPEGLDAVDAGQRNIVIANIAGGVGVVGAALAIWQFAVAPRQSSVQVAVIPATSGAGIRFMSGF